MSVTHAEMMQFTPDRDNTLYERLAGDRSNGQGDGLFIGRTAFSAVRRSLVHFDLSAIPPQAVIESVEVSFQMTMAPPSPAGGLASLYRVTANWGEGMSEANPPGGRGTSPESGDATWLHRFYDTEFWDMEGGDYLADPSASTGYAFSSTETLVFTSAPDNALIEDVEKWVRTPGDNFGWILLGGETSDFSARKLDSRETDGGDQPLLTVEYRIPSPTDNLELELVTSGLARPVVITNAGDGSERLFIVEQEGIIRIFDLASDTLLSEPFLDISSVVDDSGNEQGLLGLAFDPDYASNGRFYVYYTYDPGKDPDRTRVAMYECCDANSNEALSDETPILEFEQDATNHNGGDLHFDKDGYLVISSGDGGGSGDFYENAQNVDTLKGAMLRIDVSSSGAGGRGGAELCGLVQDYDIPPGNAFPGSADGCDEILHYGLRNPWRFSFDALTGDMYIGDVGQNAWEEIDIATPTQAGLNFGWSCFEGNNVFDAGETCPDPIPPIIEYPHEGGSCLEGGSGTVTGGYIYRGPIATLYGHYVYADYCRGDIWIATKGGGGWSSEEWEETPTLGFVSAFGQDELCNLYVTDFGAGSIYRIVSSEYSARFGFESLQCR